MRTISLLKVAGIGACCALSLLSITSVRAQGAAQLGYNVLNGNQAGTSGSFVIQTSPNNNGPYLHMFTNDNTGSWSWNSGSLGGSINYIAGYNTDALAVAHSFQVRDANNGNWVRKFEILQDGRVRIGGVPTSQSDYKLAVAGKLVAQSVYVTAPGTWADFVFAPGYKCMPLPELEAYLTANKHLPLIPAASQVKANGYSVTEMDAKLLQTIEELTLQVIRLGKEVEQLKAERPVGSK
jgi:hypothetical protein